MHAVLAWTRRTFTVASWAFTTWLLITWTGTPEQLITGAIIALCVGIAMRSLGEAPPMWSLLDPRRVAAILALAGTCVVRIIRANARLARLIWSRRLAPTSGMIVVPTSARTEGALGAAGLITSLIVDNQVVDLDRTANRLQYHAIEVPDGTADERAAQINRPIERWVQHVQGPSR